MSEWDTSLSWSGEINIFYKFKHASAGADDHDDHDDHDDDDDDDDDGELEEVNKQCCLLQGGPTTSLYMKKWDPYKWPNIHGFSLGYFTPT